MSAVGVTQTFAAITWSADRPASGRIEYGPMLDHGAALETSAGSPSVTHVQGLADLEPGTTYRFRVVADDGSGQRVVSDGHTFTTGIRAPVPLTFPDRGFPTVAVPESIDHSGVSDASGPLNRWLRRVPDGSTVVFRRGGTYKLDHGLKLDDRRDLVLDGNGATLSANTDTIDLTTPLDSLIAVRQSQNIVIRDFHFVGNSPTPGVFQPRQEHNHAVLLYGGRDFEISDVTVEGMYGDAFHLHGWARNIYIHDSHVRSVDRNGVSIIAAQDVVIERVSFDQSGYVTFDIEPNTSDQGARDVLFRSNTAGSWSDTFFSALGAEGSTVERIEVTGNTVFGRSLKTHVYLQTGRQDISFTNNTSLQNADGPVLFFAHIDGLEVVDNQQPLSSGSLASITESTNVVYVP